MRIKNNAIIAPFILGVLSVMPAAYAAVDSLYSGSNVRPISQYGLIQNVQNYSTNPFWTSTSPYNQKFPQAVYVKGPELTSADCAATVGTLVSAYCSSNDNCVGMMLSDVRPIIMLQLSRMPGHNYASSCAGYIDSEFNGYVTKYSATVPNGTTPFPTATVANPDFNKQEFEIKNPYEIHDATWNGEEWQKEKKERIQELKDLQSQNGIGYEKIVKTDFPTTFADLSFTDKMDTKKEGYEPYKNSSAYRPITIESEEEAEARRQRRRDAYCQSRYKTVLADLDADLQTVMECKRKGLPVAQCKTKGRY